MATAYDTLPDLQKTMFLLRFVIQNCEHTILNHRGNAYQVVDEYENSSGQVVGLLPDRGDIEQEQTGLVRLDTEKPELTHVAGSLSEGLKKEIAQAKTELTHLEMESLELADKVLRSPLSFIPIPESPRPFLRYLREIKHTLVDGGNVDEALHLYQDAEQFLALDRSSAPVDRGLLWLLRAGIFARQGDYEGAWAWSERAYQHLPNGSNPHRMVARLIQGNACITNGTGRVIEGEFAYGEAMEHLQKLKRIEAEQGNRQQAGIYQTLTKRLIQRLKEVQRLEYRPTQRISEPGISDTATQLGTPKPPKVVLLEQIPILDKIPASPEEPVSDDNILGYIQQTGELDFEFEGQVLDAEVLKKGKIRISEDYDYPAAQVSNDNGDSMDQAGIAPGDFVILRKAKNVPLKPASGDIVAVAFRDEDDNKATLKRIFIHSDKVILRPESSNPKHQERVLKPHDFAGENPRVAVVGIVVMVLKPGVTTWVEESVRPSPQLEAIAIAFFKNGEVNPTLVLNHEYRLFAGISKNVPPEFAIVSHADQRHNSQKFEIDVTVWAQGMKISSQWVQQLNYFRGQDTDLIEFKLIPQKIGYRKVEVNFYYQQHWLNQISLNAKVVERMTVE